MLSKYEKAGKIAADVAEGSKKLIVQGASLFAVAEKIEEMIKEKAAPAFPVNISVNENASHYTPSLNEKTVFGPDVVNIDIGVHVDGYIGDIAYTVDLSGRNEKLVEASRAALENALFVIKAGIKTNEIGEGIEKTIKGYGFKPIINLSGHGLEQYSIHSGLNIPNVKTRHGVELKEGQIIAIEPFASTGSGTVREDARVEIFAFEEARPTRDRFAREVLVFIAENYGTLPFCERWLAKKYDNFKLKLALRELSRNESLRSYPILRDVPGSLVSQAEATVVVEKDACRVLT